MAYPQYTREPLSIGAVKGGFYERINFVYRPGNWEISFTSGYGAGLGIYYLLHPGTELSMFENSLVPVSATISGNEILYEELAISKPQTSVTPKSWGSLKQGLGSSP